MNALNAIYLGMQMTIGYGAPTDDIFYGGCSSMAMLLTLEVRWWCAT